MGNQTQFRMATSIFCRVMQLVTLAAIAFIAYVVYSHEVSEELAWASFGLLTQDQANLVIVSENKTKILSYLTILPWLTPLLVLLGIFRVFGRFASRPFRLDKAGQVVRFLGYMVVLKAILDFAQQPLTLIAMTYDNPPGQRALAIGFHPEFITYFLLGITLIVAGNLTRGAVVLGNDGGGYDAVLEEAEEELEDAQEELEEAFEELDEAKAELEAAETPEEIEEALEEIAEAEEEIAEATQELAEAQADLAAIQDKTT